MPMPRWWRASCCGGRGGSRRLGGRGQKGGAGGGAEWAGQNLGRGGRGGPTGRWCIAYPHPRRARQRVAPGCSRRGIGANPANSVARAPPFLLEKKRGGAQKKGGPPRGRSVRRKQGTGARTSREEAIYKVGRRPP